MNFIGDNFIGDMQDEFGEEYLMDDQGGFWKKLPRGTVPLDEFAKLLGMRLIMLRDGFVYRLGRYDQGADDWHPETGIEEVR